MTRKISNGAIAIAAAPSLILFWAANHFLTCKDYPDDATDLGLFLGLAAGLWTAYWLMEVVDDRLRRAQRRVRRRGR